MFLSSCNFYRLAVKALGCSLGRLVLVFNCDESFDHGSMGRIVAGLATVGAWGCFGECSCCVCYSRPNTVHPLLQ